MPDLLLFFNITCQVAWYLMSHICKVMLTAPGVLLHVYGFRSTASCVLFHVTCFLPTAVCPLLHFYCFMLSVLSCLPQVSYKLPPAWFVHQLSALCSSRLPCHHSRLPCQHSHLPAGTHLYQVSTPVCQLELMSTMSALAPASWHLCLPCLH